MHLVTLNLEPCTPPPHTHTPPVPGLPAAPASASAQPGLPLPGPGGLGSSRQDKDEELAMVEMSNFVNNLHQFVVDRLLYGAWMQLEKVRGWVCKQRAPVCGGMAPVWGVDATGEGGGGGGGGGERGGHGGELQTRKLALACHAPHVQLACQGFSYSLPAGLHLPTPLAPSPPPSHLTPHPYCPRQPPLAPLAPSPSPGPCWLAKPGRSGGPPPHLFGGAVAAVQQGGARQQPEWGHRGGRGCGGAAC